MKRGSSRVAVGDREPYPPAVHQAFIRAVNDFRTEHGRDPEWHKVDFRGGTTASGVQFEIVER